MKCDETVDFAGLTRGVNLSSGYRLLAMLFKFHGMVGADLLAIDHISSGTSPTSEGECPVEVFFVNKAFSNEEWTVR
jgi:hypothetical protein